MQEEKEKFPLFSNHNGTGAIITEEKETFKLSSSHNGSLQRQQPGANVCIFNVLFQMTNLPKAVSAAPKN